MKKELIIFVSILCLSLLISCTPNIEQQNTPINKSFCNEDTDCICGGKDIQTNDCFIGNKEYYESNVNKEQQCPDFCTGIANNLETKCINNTCKNVRKQKIQSNECETNLDCVKGGCSGQLCISKNNKQRSFTTCEMNPEYECYQKFNCECLQNKCSWNNEEELNNCIKEKQQN